MPLEHTAQLDWAAGMFQSIAPHLIPQNGAWKITDGLLDDDGSIYQRGGNEYLSTVAFGERIPFVWDGYLGPGRRTVIANPDDFGVLDGGEVPVNLGLGGLTFPRRAVELDGMLFIGGGTMYGGSRKAAVYSTGTIEVTQGSTTVEGSGTTWNTLVDAGMLLRVAGAGRYYVVASITDTTHLELAEPYEAANATGQAYTLSPLVTLDAPYKTADIYAVAANRLFAISGNIIDFSERNDPNVWTFPATGTPNRHLIPEGGQALGAGVRDDVLLIFATNGLWELSGLHFNIVDPNGNQQHRLRRVSEDLILVNNEGIATWLGRLVTPCADGIWLVDGVSEPVRVSDSISALWRAYVQLGYRAGQATVFRSHYLLPVLDGGGTPVDMLVCRLDRQVPTRLGQVRPWTRMSGFGGSSAAMAVRPGGASGSRQPRLLAGSEDGRVADSTAFFEPSGASALDADDSEVMGEIQTRDYPVKDGLGFGTVRKIRARYELYSTEEAGLELAYATGLEEGTEGIWDVSLWDEATWAGGLTDDPVVWSIIAGLAPEDNGEHAYTWRLVKKARFIRFRLRLSGPASKLVLRTLELFARHSGKA